MNVSELWDVDAYRRDGGKPWTFFAYPKTLADEQRLPRDEDAVRYLAALHKAGVRVGITEYSRMPNDVYFACPFEDFPLLNSAIEQLERQGEFPKGFAISRCEYLYSLAER